MLLTLRKYVYKPTPWDTKIPCINENQIEHFTKEARKDYKNLKENSR